ncbi:MAG: hypothetical protein U0234_10335 [Sandaracinus sp.]
MAERSRFSLPTLGLGADVDAEPSIDAAREALGGRLATEPGAGELVIVALKRGDEANGVVVCVEGSTRDVWIGEGRFVRTSAERLRPLARAAEGLAIIAAETRRYAALREGDPVRAIKRDGSAIDGRLVEKCRYGALVAKGDRVVAVSFRRVMPAPS